MSEHITILVVDDDEKILFAFQEVFRADGYETLVARNGEEALSRVDESRPSVVFMDITMPLLDGLETLRRIKQTDPATPVILITGFGTMQTAVQAMQLGAFEYLTKPLDVGIIRDVMRRALASRSAATVESAPPSTEVNPDKYEIIGNSAPMQEIYKLIGSISTTPNHTSVLILGESGTGKELVAHAIHQHGHHAHEPFIPINCTALPAELLESELFGHEKGAFTGAVERKLGKFEIAKAGTLFLDEIGNLSMHLQQKLLRVLQEREFERLGGNTPIRVQARFITATNLDLADAVHHRTFREDLYFRLNVVTVHLPPLRSRRDDISRLANHFLLKYNHQSGKHIKGISDEAMHILTALPYPGNVRELENLLERAVMLTNGELILPESVHAFLSASPAFDIMPGSGQTFSSAREQALEQFERNYVIDLLRTHHGNVTNAAKASDMTRQNLQRLMKKHSIQSEDFKG